MADLIERQAAIDALWEVRQRLDEYMEECLRRDMVTSRALAKAERNRIENDLCIIESLPSAQQWIPVTERLPEHNHDVLLQFSNNMGVGFYEIYDNGWAVNTGDGIYSEVGDGEETPLAWMPLPEPWKGEEDVVNADA